MTLQALLDQAVALFRQGQLAQAESVCARLLADAPELFQARYLAGILAIEQGRPAEALAHYDRALAARPQDAEVLFNRGNAFFALQRFDEALQDYDAALAGDPRLARGWNNRGNALKALGRLPEAIESYGRALALDPGVPQVWSNRAALQWALQRYEEALASYDGQSRAAPGLAEAWVDRGNALRVLRRPLESLASYDHALSLQPSFVKALNNRAIVLRDMGRIDEALASYARAVAIKPDYAEGLFNYGKVEWMEKRALEPAILHLEQAMTAEPDLPYVRGLLLHLKMMACDWRDFDRQAALVDEEVRAGRPVIEPFAHQALSSSPADLMAAAVTFNRHRYPAAAPLSPSPRPGRDTIRLGYLSGEFYEQATAHLMAGLYEAHDRARFELVALDNGPDDASPMRRRLEAAFGGFVDLKPLSDLAAAERIRAEGIDILIDLNGYFGNHRTGVLAHRPAPVQVNYLGFPGTLGAPYIDYIIADRIVAPEEDAPFFTEKLVWLPGCYQANDGRRGIAARPLSRAECGLPERDFVFCNFNNSYKFTPAQFAVWMRLLRQVEGSVLWLLDSNAAFAANLRREAALHQVAPERLVFAPHLPQDQHLARLALADLSLDSLPYNQHTTGSDALWAGVPLLTCRGRAFAGRVGASLLHAVGLPELVTQSLEDYEALALALAREPQRLEVLRRKLAQNRPTAPLFDTPRFARHIEAAYARMWEIHRKGEAPRGFAVPPLSSDMFPA